MARIVWYKKELETASPKASERAEQILKDFCDGLPEVEHYRLVQLFYGVIVQNVSYDYEAVKTREATAFMWYKPLLAGTGVCEAVAQLFFKLCITRDIPCSIIHGEACSNGTFGLHAWNMVFLEIPGRQPQWYHLDATWDLHKTQGQFRYFLRSDAYMRAHGHEWLNKNFPAASADAPRLPPLSPKVVHAAGKLLNCVKEG